MPRGQPDYGLYAPTEQYATLADLAELARRLTDLIYSDGRGATVFHDDFEGTLLKWGSVTANGGTLALDSTYAQSGSQSVKLDVAKVLIAKVGIWHEFGVQISQRLGGEISFCKPSAHTAFYNFLNYHNSPTLYSAEAYIDFSTNKLYIRQANGDYLLVATLDAFSASDQAFNSFKLVADFDAKVYERVKVSGAWYNLANEPLYQTSTALSPRIVSQLVLQGLDVTGSQLWLDDFIFTQEEP